ncbi:MAG: iron-sulfur cluster assembly scaffold protein [Candidatus Gracilibacteria bacterium]|nr:iron-sulfur cluster assembly scaffold protein [Candidatus Gracilibacteria bacterium]
MYNEIITHYGKNPSNKKKVKNADIRYWEDNGLCGDSLEVFIKLDGEKIIEWGFEGNTSIITTACASIFGEDVIGKTIPEVMTLGYKHIISLIKEEVSPRRKQASVLGILATRNALHEHLLDGKVDTFEDLLNI